MSSVGQPETIVEAIRENARRDDGLEFLRLILPGKPDCVRSYAELVQDANRWCLFYVSCGLRPGDRVIVILPHSLELYSAYIGALLGGFVPAMFAFPSPKFSEELYFATVGQLIGSSRSRILVAEADLREKLRIREAEMLANVRLVGPEDVPTHGAEAPIVAVDPKSTAFLQYSSGTTGVKKGVAVSHKALLWQIAAYAQAIQASSADRIATWLPLYHDMGLIAAFFLPLIFKIPIVAISPFDWVKRPATLVQAVSQHRSTLAWMPNFAFNFMASSISDKDLNGVTLSSLRGLVNCSEPVLAHSHEAFLERFAAYGFRADALAASYAMAENTFAITSAGFGSPPKVDHIDNEEFERAGKAIVVPPGHKKSRTVVSSGHALKDTLVRVVDENGVSLPDRRVGELLVSSPSLMNGYDGDAAATAAVLVDDALLTGDLGYIADNEVFITGRKKDLIIVGGRNIYPQDVEAAMALVPGVIPGRCVAFGVVNEEAGTERLVVVAESEIPAETHSALKAKIYKAVAERTEIVPSDIRIVAPRWLVKSSSGKNARGANRERYLTEFIDASAPNSNVPMTDGSGMLDRVRVVVRHQLARGPSRVPAGFDDDTPLIKSGLIDSFGLAELILGLEAETGRLLTPDMLHDIDRINTVRVIAAMLEGFDPLDSAVAPDVSGEVPLTYPKPPARRAIRGFWSFFYRLLFAVKGVRCGSGLHVLGPLLLQIDGKAANIRIGDNVTLMPGVHLKNRENGTIVLHDGVKLDTMTRLVVANDAVLTLGENVALGMGTVINAGVDVTIGRSSLSSTYCMINASDHAMAVGTPIRDQNYEHAPIVVGEDVFLGAHCYIGRGSRIENGAVVSSGAAVTGPIPSGAIVQGRPARVVKFRS